MIETKPARTWVDELNRCQDRFWVSREDGNHFDGASPVNKEVLVDSKSETFAAPMNGSIYVGLKVFLPHGQFIGKITKLLHDPAGHVSHLTIRTAGLFGRHKVVPVEYLSDITPKSALLSITRGQFMELPGYHTDLFIAEEADRALWKDLVLRHIDYHEIDVRVRDGFIMLNGHVLTGMNQWRAETAVQTIPGILGVNSHLISDDKLIHEVAGALAQIEQDENCKLNSKVENGLAVLMGDVRSTSLRDQAGQCVANIPWVRGVINEIHVTGMALDPGDQRFLQPLIGKELIFKDALSVTIRKVVINPHNRRVVAVVVFGQFPDPLRTEMDSDYRESRPDRLVTLPIDLILHLTRSAGFLNIDSTETVQFNNYDPSRYMTPEKDWLPPYPYCTDEVLFLAE
jgi:osmotically-inducible protein OsmY